ncbi:hypothetical protein Tco_0071909 [Tanacetum coccineum]
MVSNKLLCVTPLNKQAFQKKIVVPKTEDKHVLLKIITLQTSPNKQKAVETNKNVIAPRMYKVNNTKKQEKNTNKVKSVLPSTALKAATSVRRPSSRDSPSKNSVLSNTKNSSEKVEVSIRTNKKTNVASKNVVSSKLIVTYIDAKNALKVKNVLCVSCSKSVLIPCHDKCLANYKLNVHFKIQKALFTTPRSKSVDTTPIVSKTWFAERTAQPKTLDTTPVVSKTKVAVVTLLSAKKKVSSAFKSKSVIRQDITLSKFMKNKIKTSMMWQQWYEIQPNVGLGHNLFSVGQFCDGDLKVAFSSKTCYVRNLEGDDLLTGARESNLYTISISDMVASSLVCLMSKATSTKKPNVEYFYVFGSLSYPTNDQDDLGKMKPKAYIGIFIRYSKTSRGFRIYNRRTKKIMETIHVKFNELTAMASEYSGSEPVPNQFINDDSSARSSSIPLKAYLDNLFGPMYEEYFEK